MTTAAHSPILSLLGIAVAMTSACASPGPPSRAGVSGHLDRTMLVRTALAQVGVPYRRGGSSPDGFDCSGLVLYSYRKAGIRGLPHSAAALDALSQQISLRDLRPGDLLFFRLTGRKTSHVGIYLGNRTFVHAPSGGKRVEKVSFDHVYWGKKLGRAGRIPE